MNKATRYAPPRRGLHLFLVGASLAVAAQAICLWYAWPFLIQGQLLDADSYTWLGHVQRLLDTGQWFDHIQPRANWPYGELQHSTRPFDALLLAGTWLLTPFLGREAALFWTGASLAPLMFIILCGAVAWIATRSFGPWRGILTVTVILLQFPVVAYSLPARVDHHSLIMLIFCVAGFLTARVIKSPELDRIGLLAGLIAGLGLWLSPEFLLMLMASFVALGLMWVLEGGERCRAGLMHALGLTGGIVLALLAEYPIAELLIPHFERISSVHLIVALVAVVFWLIVGLLQRRGPGQLCGNVWQRIFVGWLLGGAGLTFVAVQFPEFFAGPMAGMDKRAEVILVGLVMETRGLLQLGPAILLLYLGSALLALPVVGERILRVKDPAMRNVWLYLGLLLLVYVVASLFMLRFSPFAALVASVVLADALARLGIWLFSGRALVGRPKILARGGLAVIITLLTLAVGLNLSFTGNSLAGVPQCHQQLKPLSDYLESSHQPGAQPHVIVAMADMGPEILYRSRHRVIATPSMSNQAGAIAIFNVLDARDDSTTRQILRERGIDRILICRALPFSSPGPQDRRLYARLMSGEVPPWLGRVPLPPEIAGVYELFAVSPEWSAQQ